MLCHMCIFAMVETWVNCPCWWMVINPLIGICIPMTRIPVRNGWPYHIYHDLTIEHMQLDVSHCLHMQSLQYTLQYMVQCTFIICVAWHAEDTLKTCCSSFSELWRVGCGLTLSDALDVGVHTFLGATLCRSPKGGPLLGEFLVTLRSAAKFWKSWQSSFPFWFSLVISCHLLILCHSCVLIFFSFLTCGQARLKKLVYFQLLHVSFALHLLLFHNLKRGRGRRTRGHCAAWHCIY